MNGKRLHIGAVQMNCTLGAPEENVTRALDLLKESDGIDIICLPELFTSGYHLKRLGDQFHELAEPIPGPTTERFVEAARQHQVSILGTIVERDGGALYDTTFVIDRQHGYLGKYRKSHLYPAEHRYFTPGDRLKIFEVSGVPIGIAICFEHAFPPIFAALALQGAKIVFNPTAVPVGYEYLMELRSRARAQDNQLFIAAANHVGSEGDVVYCGLSQITDPKGRVLAQVQRDERVISAEVDLSLINQERDQEPALRHFRPELYIWEEAGG
ncbi:MAG: carbon-nitrogen hydrolase family protein [Candidatus Bipolaricaulia bacterium]